MNKYQPVINFIKTMKAINKKSLYGGISLDAIVIPDNLSKLNELLKIDKDLFLINKYDLSIENKLNNLIDEYGDKAQNKKIFVINKSVFEKYQVSWGALFDYASEVKEVQNA